ncbi:MAG: hypothetical protein ACI857_001732 [Arenicella sp.]|jgi:hypothetical protein
MKKLKSVLLANAAFSVLTGASTLFFSNAIAKFFSIESPNILSIIGSGLLLFGIYVAFIAIKKTDQQKESKVISYADFTWVISSIVLLIVNPYDFTSAAMVAFSSIAIIVLSFGLLQVRYNKQKAPLK